LEFSLSPQREMAAMIIIKIYLGIVMGNHDSPEFKLRGVESILIGISGQG